MTNLGNLILMNVKREGMEGLGAIYAAGGFANLVYVSLHHPQLSQEGAEAFLRAIGGTPHRGATLESIAIVFCLFSEGPDFRAGAERDVEVFRGQLEEAKAQGICVNASLEVEFYEWWIKNSGAARGNGEQSKVERLT